MNLYIAVEGLDGIGKTTFVKNLERLIEEHYGPNVRTIYEPGTTEAGKELRAMMKSGEYDLSRRSELLMMMAARSDLAEKELYPDFSGIIISDRCWLSTLAYQVTADPSLIGQFRSILDNIAHRYPRGIMFVLDGTVELVRERSGVKAGRDAIENASDDHWRRRQHLYSAVAHGKAHTGDYFTYPDELAVPAVVQRGHGRGWLTAMSSSGDTQANFLLSKDQWTWSLGDGRYVPAPRGRSSLKRSRPL